MASGEQQTGTEQINKAVVQLDQVIQQNASAAQEMASTAEELAGQAENLQTAMEFFKVDGKNGGRRPHELAMKSDTPKESSDSGFEQF